MQEKIIEEVLDDILEEEIVTEISEEEVIEMFGGNEEYKVGDLYEQDN